MGWGSGEVVELEGALGRLGVELVVGAVARGLEVGGVAVRVAVWGRVSLGEGGEQDLGLVVRQGFEGEGCVEESA